VTYQSFSYVVCCTVTDTEISCCRTLCHTALSITQRHTRGWLIWLTSNSQL